MSTSASAIGSILDTISRVGAAFAAAAQTRATRFRAAFYRELRRVASTLAMALLFAALAAAALVFGAVAILIAAWDTHPVLAAALIALGFGILAIVSLLLMRSNSR